MTKDYTYQKGYFDVTDGHSLYYELYGNPQGKPAVFLHGGPGGNFDDKDKRFFDPKVWNVLFFDQRGSGKSKPFATLHENTTPKLVQDITALLDNFNMDNVLLFGGSWGATLALTYAIQHKKRVARMILRGIYFSNSADKKHLLDGAIKQYFPEYWERFMRLVPEDERANAIAYYLDKMQHGNEETKDKYCYEWSFFESAVLRMQMSEQEIIDDLKDGSYKSLSPIEAIYMLHNSFLPDNYILDNAHVLSDIPVSIVHGRYDMVCPPLNAWELHKKINGSKLHFVFAGHSSSEPEIEKKLIEEVSYFATLDE